jgi:alpha-beta hydrolase superfamily lysophospholipase
MCHKEKGTMTSRIRKIVHHVFLMALYGALGVFITLVTVFVIMMNDRPDLSVWHTADLDEEFTVESDVSTFAQYLELEDRLFREMDDEVAAKIAPGERGLINRFNKGSLSDPEQWDQNWNRSFEMPADQPTAAVLLLHGMSDSPYSLRNLGEALHASGAYVVGLRIPGHGTAPSGLVRVTWQDMEAAVTIAMKHVADKADGQPVHIVGYSNGGALAVNYALEAANDSSLPQVTSLALLSPEIGITGAAAFAVWQARLGVLLGLDKLAWNSLLPEYDPYKYGSFAVNAGDVAHRLTNEIQRKITVLENNGNLENLAPILAFSSIVDATVSAPVLIKGLFNRIPENGHELVLFDINSVAEVGPLLNWSPKEMFNALTEHPQRTFTLSLVTNIDAGSLDVMLSSLPPGKDESVDEYLEISWPPDLYSLTHVALPFPPDDPLYGVDGEKNDAVINLGNLALRGERGVLQIPASEMLRQRWNPFYSLLEDKVLRFFELEQNTIQPSRQDR